jgi:hypothetical protein
MANEADGFLISMARDFNGGLAITDRAVRSMYEVTHRKEENRVGEGRSSPQKTI